MDTIKKIKEYKFKVQELADYLNISRATIYRYIDSFDKGDYDSIDDKALFIFKLIDEKKAKDKLDVVLSINGYNRQMLMPKQMDDLIYVIQKHVYDFSDSNKTEFLKTMFCSKKFDKAIDFIMYLDPFMNEEGELVSHKLGNYKPIDSYSEYLEVLKRVEIVKSKEIKE